MKKLNDSIQYKGSVNIIYKDAKTGKIKHINTHNEGKLRLFTFLSKALAGEIIASARPQKIDLYTGTENNLQSALYYPIPYDSDPKTYHNGKVEEEANQVVFIFNVPGRSISQSISTQNPITNLKLLDQNNVECAQITLSDQQQITSIDWTTNIVIEWTLTFKSTII